MWRSSGKRASSGFTLMEVLVVLASLGMILWMAGQLLFPMRAAAERQRLQVEARQAARSGADYTSYLVRGATDLNDVTNPRNPAAVLTYLWKGVNPASAGSHFPACPGDNGCVQLTYNNVIDASFATLGSDIITLTAAEMADPVVAHTAGSWPGAIASGSTQYWAFSQGCVPGGTGVNSAANSQANYDQFKQLTDPNDTGTSIPLLLKDPTLGTWLIYRITDYRAAQRDTSCTVENPLCVVEGNVVPCIEAGTALTGTDLNPPGGLEVISNGPDLVLGSHFVTLRVCNGWLEQKNGVFDSLTDNNCPTLAAGAEFPQVPPHDPSTGWSPLLPNVEDFQVAYMFRNGDLWNTPGGTLTGDNCTDNVPSFDMSASPPTRWDVRNVIALRVTITGRSSTPMAGAGKVPARPPAAEDHNPTTAPTDYFYRYQASVAVQLRNRISGI